MTNSQYTVLIVGMGKRGLHHGTAFHANPRFKVVGICDIDKPRLEAAAPKVGNPKIGTDAAALAKELKPDLFCFCTLPNLRLDFVKLGVESGARLIAFEKPVAMTSAEGLQIKQALDKSRAKAVVKSWPAARWDGSTPFTAPPPAGPLTCSAI
ncbi:MAG: hypothetical protein DME25_08260 [Verrucomicrobia bacterium]|nr:MAG: hypothetical protein DME25_08260 [Verrucomicrobiota bacterium]